MARDSRQVRHERRYGKPERLADCILSSGDKSDWGLPPFAIDGASPNVLDLYWKEVEHIKKNLASSPVIEATSACRLYWDHTQDVWEHGDFPSVAPPFSSFFVEARHPGLITVEHGRRVYPAKWCPEQWGLLFTANETEEGMLFPFTNLDTMEVEWKDVARKWDVGIRLVMKQKGALCFYPILGFMAVGSDGSMIKWPTMLGGGANVTLEEKAEIASLWTSLTKPIFFALCFVHCKNVTLEINYPDRGLNNERRKAGLKPFVRYHTINIEPMKRVLKTEGQSDTEGLKRALHICRGHFSTYSEERPLFGRIAGTFWVPAHVRGSIKEGVVVSDYKVNPHVS